MNTAIMIGRLTRDPEVRYSNDGKSVANFDIAVDRRFKREGQPQADFFRCVAFGKTAEFVEKYIGKGVKIAIEGAAQNDNYTDQNGVKHYGTRIVVNNVEFAQSKAGTSENGTQKLTGDNQSKDTDDFMQIPDGIEEELLFE